MHSGAPSNKEAALDIQRLAAAEAHSNCEWCGRYLGAGLAIRLPRPGRVVIRVHAACAADLGKQIRAAGTRSL